MVEGAEGDDGVDRDRRRRRLGRGGVVASRSPGALHAVVLQKISETQSLTVARQLRQKLAEPLPLLANPKARVSSPRNK